MFFKNLRVYRLAESWALDTQHLESQRFQPCSSQTPVSTGWVPPTGDELAYEHNGQILLCMRTEKKLLPSSVVNQVVRDKAQDIAEEQGFRVGRKQMRELKEDVITELLPKAFSVQQDTKVWIDPKNRWLVIDAASNTAADEVMGLIAKTFDPFPALPLHTEQSPSSAMTSWLLQDEAPANFTIDQDTELRATSESRAVVKYLRHSVDNEEAAKHIQSGKRCTRLALTWADKISFVLDDGLVLRRVDLLDVLTEQANSADNEEEHFQSNFILMSSEYAKLLNDVVDALGGEKDADMQTQ